MTRAVISTDKGDIELELFEQSAPKTTKNFIDLARKGFYDDVIFHRVIPNFMIQGGDGQYGKKSSLDTSRVGTGGPGYKFEDEPVTGSYTRGTLAMANAGPDTNGSQFFLVFRDSQFPPSYTVFGTIDEAGLATIDKIAAVGNDNSIPAGGGAPNEDVTIESVTIG